MAIHDPARDELAAPASPAGVGSAALTSEVVVADYAADAEDPLEAAGSARSQWRLVGRRFFRHKLAVLALGVLVVFYLLALFAPQVAPYELTPRLTGDVLLGARKGPS